LVQSKAYRATVYPAVSAARMWTFPLGSTRCMAEATRSGSTRVRHMIVEPEPESHPPMAPARTPAWITFGSCGISGVR